MTERPSDDRARRRTDDRLDVLYSILEDGYRRRVVGYFLAPGDEVATLTDLADHVREREGLDDERVAIQLHHVTLPQLAETGVVEYDPRSRTVRYWRNPELERLFRVVTRSEVVS